MKRNTLLGTAVLVLILVLVSTFSVAAQDTGKLKDMLNGLKADKPWGKVVVDGAFELWQVKAATFLDVRTPKEYQDGHIPGAILVPLDEIPSSLGKLPKDRDALIVVYCKSGWRASIGMVTMRLLGYTNAKGFDGSWLAWTKAKHPEKKGTMP